MKCTRFHYCASFLKSEISNMECSPIVSSCLLLLTLSTIFDPTFASRKCKFPAVFNFGDSNSDTAGLSSAFIPLVPPYGETYFGMPAGRYSDGRLIVDFLARSLNLPFLSAYLNSMGTNFRHGANFATAGSTIKLPTSIIPHGQYSPFSLEVQFLQFLQFKNRSQLIRQKGGLFAKLMPKEQYFAKALYTFDIGQNDLEAGFFGNMTVEQVNASIPDIVATFSNTIKGIYELGGRSFWIHNTGPFGCLPYVLVNFGWAEKDSAGCAKPYNEVAKYFNYQLKQAVHQLRNDLPSAAFTYVDVYSVRYALITNPEKYGFEYPLVACCGYGGKYNFDNNMQCGQTVASNGTQKVVGSCKRPCVRVNWDGVHYTDAANKFVFYQISTGTFSDPPIPLQFSCVTT